MATFREDDTFAEARFLDIVQGDRGLALELAEIFLSELEPRMHEIKAAIRSREAGRLQSAAHALKGSAMSMSAKAVGAAAHSLELVGASGTVEGAEVLFKELESNAVDLRDRLTAFANGN
jgi:HPt (histidine-containing phosphotransfer) domain-containing protein